VYGSGLTQIITHVRDGNVSGTMIMEDVHDTFNISAGHSWNFEGDYETGSAVTKQFVVSIIGTGGNTTIVGGGTTNPSYIEIEDIGASGYVTVQNTP
jgi:hypothetical protein